MWLITFSLPGYDRMSTFEKLKAKTKFDLSSAFKGDEAGPDELGKCIYTLRSADWLHYGLPYGI